MASLDDIITALQARAAILKKQNEAQKTYAILDAYLNNRSPEGTAAFEYGKLLSNEAKNRKIDLNEALLNSGGLTGSYSPGIGQSSDQIALHNLLFSGEMQLPQDVNYNLPSDILNQVIKNNLLERALLDIDPIANAMINPTNDSDFSGSLKAALSGVKK